MLNFNIILPPVFRYSKWSRLDNIQTSSGAHPVS
jgi:hypothetical protein